MVRDPLGARNFGVRPGVGALHPLHGTTLAPKTWQDADGSSVRSRAGDSPKTRRAASRRSRGLRGSRPRYRLLDEVARRQRIGSVGAYRASPGAWCPCKRTARSTRRSPCCEAPPAQPTRRGTHRRRGRAQARSVRGAAIRHLASRARSVLPWMLPVICPPGRAEADLTPAQRSVRRGPDPRSAGRSILDDLRGSPGPTWDC